MGPKWAEPDFSQNFHLVISSIDPKCSLDMQIQEDPMTSFREIGQKVHFWAKKGIFGPKFLDPKRAKRDFSGKIRNCHFLRIRKPQLCAKFQKIPMNRF